MKLKTKYDKQYHEEMNSNWKKSHAKVLIPYLPGNLQQLMKRTGYSKTSVEKFLIELRRDKKVITIQAGKKTWYEERINNA